MRLKANLHFHTAEDPKDPVSYTLKQGIDHAASLGFEVLAVTCHNYFAWTKEHAKYAEKKGILLVPGIEVNVGENREAMKRNRYRKSRHVLVINADKDAEKIYTFKDLSLYRKAHPEIAVIAPHPYFYGHFSLKKWLEKYAFLFDAVEHSWFYSKRFFNRNKKAIGFGLKNELPIIATSDTHFLDFNFMERNYATLDLNEKTVADVVRAIKEGDFENTTSPSSFLRDMVWAQGKFMLRKVFVKK